MMKIRNHLFDCGFLKYIFDYLIDFRDILDRQSVSEFDFSCVKIQRFELGNDDLTCENHFFRQRISSRNVFYCRSDGANNRKQGGTIKFVS